MKITASLVKELRERTGVGMMECKKALVDNDGDIEKAIEAMRISGQAKAEKKAGRIAAEGLVSIEQSSGKAAMIEFNSETDFLSKADDFIAFSKTIAETALKKQIDSVESLNSTALADGKTIEETRKELIMKLGENMNLRRIALIEADNIGVYMHGSRIGVLVGMNGGDAALARDVAMHIAASRPVCVSVDDMSAETVEKERQVLIAQAEDSGKPPEIIEKMIAGRLNKYLKEVTLLGQPFVKNPDQTIDKLLKAAGASVSSFVCFEVGEGIEKKQEDFAAEVAKQAGGS
jgi:elongation factor Ts